MSFVASPSMPSILGPSIQTATYETDPIREIANRISRLSYRDMKRFAEELNELNIQFGRYSLADGLSEWADQKLNPTTIRTGL